MNSVFEAYSRKKFRKSYILLCPPSFKNPQEAMIKVDVGRKKNERRVTKEFCYVNLWKEIIDKKEMSKVIAARNKRHLQQAMTEDGRSKCLIMRKSIKNKGINDTVKQLLKEEINLSKVDNDAVKIG